MEWTRRELLETISAGIGVGLAGCNTDSDDDATSNTTGTRTAATTRRRPNAKETTLAVRMNKPTTETHESATDARGTSTRLTSDKSGTVMTTEPGPVATDESGTVMTTEPGPVATDESGTVMSTSEQAAHTIGMFTGLYFDPVGLHVEPGTTISFRDVSGAHSATAFHPAIETYSIAPERRVPKGASPWNTGVIYEVGRSKAVTFETEGTYDYFCIPHVQAGMVGRIVVGEPGGPATESRNPYATYYPLPDSARIVSETEVPFEAVAPK